MCRCTGAGGFVCLRVCALVFLCVCVSVGRGAGASVCVSVYMCRDLWACRCMESGNVSVYLSVGMYGCMCDRMSVCLGVCGFMGLCFLRVRGTRWLDD